MIVIVGNKYKMGGLAEVIKNRLNEDVVYLEESSDILAQENDILNAAANSSYIIYDVDQYYNEGEEIVSIIKRIYRTNKAKPILYLPTDNPKNEIVKAALAHQIKNFINSSLLMGEQKDQLEKILVGFYDANERADIAAAQKEVIEEETTLKEFTQSLYDAKQREETKENTIIINKKRASEVAFKIVKDVLRAIFDVASMTLISLALITLIYKSPRTELFNTLLQIMAEIKSMF